MVPSIENVFATGLQVGHLYERPALASLWGYKSHAAISRGIVTPAGTSLIILFVTKDKQPSGTQYDDDFDGRLLQMEGEASGSNDERLIASSTSGDKVYLFYRPRHHQPFVYCGEVNLLRYEKHTGEPTRFTFEVREGSVSLHPNSGSDQT